MQRNPATQLAGETAAQGPLPGTIKEVQASEITGEPETRIALDFEPVDER